MKSYSKNIILFLLLSMVPFVSYGGWTPYLDLNHNYFQSYHPNANVITLVVNAPIHNCGNQNDAYWANIQDNLVGTEGFKMINAVVISAWVTKKQVSLNVDGCQGVRANITGIRMGN